MKTEIIAAIAMANGAPCLDRHFGDADYYEIYRIHDDGAEKLKTILLPEIPEEGHADPRKAKGIAQEMQREGVQILVANRFGGNIVHQQKVFGCVVVRRDSLNDMIQTLQDQRQRLQELWEMGKTRPVLNLNKSI